MPKTAPPTNAWPKTSAPAQRALEGAGYKKLSDLTQVSEAELLALHGMGPKALGILKAALAERGLSLKPAKPSAKQ
jgi:DNA-directed RNA polymerase alpha subunit